MRVGGFTRAGFRSAWETLPPIARPAIYGSFRGQSGKDMLNLRFTALDPKRSSAADFCCDAQHTPDLTIW
jgi:hypothetical protein